MGPDGPEAEDDGDDGDWNICWDFERNDWGLILKSLTQVAALSLRNGVSVRWRSLVVWLVLKIN